MSDVDKDIERLIVRRLDGALSEEDELALDRALIREPEARRLMDDYRRIDDLAAAALLESLGSGGSASDRASRLADRLSDRSQDGRLESRSHTHGSHAQSAAGRQGTRRSRVWARALVPGAIAAALLAVFVARFPWTANPPQPAMVAENKAFQSIPHVVRSNGNPNLRDSVMRNATHRPSLKRNTGREVFGVVGDNGNIYWIEVERTRTIRRPKLAARNNM